MKKTKIHKKLICMISGLFQCPLSIFLNTDIKVDKQKNSQDLSNFKVHEKGDPATSKGLKLHLNSKD